MTKKKFLSELEKKLSVLNESEIKDIMNEYNDIIDEKVKHGKTEKEAIEDFGSLDDLVKEILSAYKINPNYKEAHKDEFEASAKKLGEDFDDFIKKGAEKASKATKKVMDQVRENDQEFTVEFVFELLFKAIAALLLCVVATIPMTIIKELVESLLRMFVSPLSNILIFLFEFVLGILFLILCGFIFIAMFKQYVTPNKKKEVKKEEIKKEIKSEEKETEKKEKLVKSSGPDALGTLIITIMKIAVIFFILLPIWMMEFGIGICLVFLIAALIKGIFFIGPLFLCAGGICLLSEISSIIYRMIFTEKKPHFYGIIIGLVFLVIGTFLTIDLVMNFDYIKDVPSGYHQKTYTENLTVDSNTLVAYDDNMKYQTQIDNTMPDHQIKVDVIYYEDIYQTPWLERENENGTHQIAIELEDEKRTDFKFHYQMLIDDLKEFQLHDYRQLEDYEVVITGNENTLKLISLENAWY